MILGLFDFFRPKKSVFDLIFEKLNQDSLEAEFSGNWKLRQAIQVKILWLTFIKNQNAVLGVYLPFIDKNNQIDVSSLSMDQIKFPEVLDDKEILDIKFAQKIYEEYGKILADSGEYQECLFKPASILPYPKHVIKEAIDFYIHCLVMDSPLFTLPSNKDELIENLEVINSALEYFLEVNKNELPTDKKENMIRGFELKEGNQE